jgi:Cu/Ag efflux protein CusF
MKLIVASVALTLIAACGNQPGNHQPSTPAPSGPAAAVQSHSYKGVGIVKRLDPKLPAIEIDHQDIEGLMPAMQMEFPVTNVALLSGLAVNDRIDFTVESNAGEIKVTDINKK